MNNTDGRGKILVEWGDLDLRRWPSFSSSDDAHTSTSRSSSSSSSSSSSDWIFSSRKYCWIALIPCLTIPNGGWSNGLPSRLRADKPLTLPKGIYRNSKKKERTKKKIFLPSWTGNLRIKFPPNNKYFNEVCLSRPFVGICVIWLLRRSIHFKYGKQRNKLSGKWFIWLPSKYKY
jgi:hypothetical protein